MSDFRQLVESQINERWFKKFHARRYDHHVEKAKEAEDENDLDAALYHHKRAAHHAPTVPVRSFHVQKHNEYRKMDLSHKSPGATAKPPVNAADPEGKKRYNTLYKKYGEKS